MSPIRISSGKVAMPAMIRGATRYLNGLVESVTSASICSVTRIVPISAAMDEPTRAATIRPARTGPSSRVMLSTTISAIAPSAPTEFRAKPV